MLGEHDFAAFCRKREGATTVRALRRLEWERDADGVAIGRVVADAFCHNMVRALVGALLPVGEGSRPRPGRPRCSPRQSGTRPCGVVPAHGLSLEEVRYPAAGPLAAGAATHPARQDRGRAGESAADARRRSGLADGRVTRLAAGRAARR